MFKGIKEDGRSRPELGIFLAVNVLHVEVSEVAHCAVQNELPVILENKVNKRRRRGDRWMVRSSMGGSGLMVSDEKE